MFDSLAKKLRKSVPDPVLEIAEAISDYKRKNFGAIRKGSSAKDMFKGGGVYENYSLAFSCIDRIGNAAAQAAWMVQMSSDGGENWEAAPHDSDLSKLIRYPNREYGIDLHAFTEKMISAMAAGGRGIALITRDDSGVPIEITPRADIDISLDKKGKKVYKINRKVIDPEDFMEIQKPKFSSTWDVADPELAASVPISTDKAAGAWQRGTLENSALPNGVLRVDTETTDEEIDVLHDEFTSLYTGTSNARSVAILRAQFDWIAMNLTAADMDFLDGRKLQREIICGVYGVPPTVVGIMENATLANVEGLDRQFWFNTVLPYLNKLQSQLTKFAESYNDKKGKSRKQYRIVYSAMHIPAVFSYFKERLDCLKSLMDAGVPLNVAQKMLNLDVPFYEGWDISYMPKGMVPADFYKDEPIA